MFTTVDATDIPVLTSGNDATFDLMWSIDSDFSQAQRIVGQIEDKAGMLQFLDIYQYVADCLKGLGLAYGSPDDSRSAVSEDIVQRITRGINDAFGEVFDLDDADHPRGEKLLAELGAKIGVVRTRLSHMLRRERDATHVITDN
jgi:hypothetical protein